MRSGRSEAGPLPFTSSGADFSSKANPIPFMQFTIFLIMAFFRNFRLPRRCIKKLRIFYDEISFKIARWWGVKFDGGETDIRCKLLFLMWYKKRWGTHTWWLSECLCGCGWISEDFLDIEGEVKNSRGVTKNWKDKRGPWPLKCSKTFWQQKNQPQLTENSRISQKYF